MDIPIDKSAVNDISIDPLALHRLTQWLSPAFPVGAYAYSHGLEWAVAAGDVRDRRSTQDWISALIKHGSVRNDGIFLTHAYGAKCDTELAEITELAQAFVSSAERLQETTEMGAALAKAIGEISSIKIMPAPYPIVLGVAARMHNIPLVPTLSLHLHSFGTNLVSVAQRLVPLGQIEGQGIVASLSETIEQAVPQILDASLSDLGGCAFRADMAAMKHETQKTRLFRT